MVNVTEIAYKCTACGSIDHYKLFEGEPKPPVLNCWNCGAGRKYENIHEQAARRVGMMPVEPEVAKAN